MFGSKSNLYWNPEQPPPSTVILKHTPSSAISFKRFAQLSLIINSSADLTAASVDTPRDDVIVDTLYHGELGIRKPFNGIRRARYILVTVFNVSISFQINKKSTNFFIAKNMYIEIYTKYMYVAICTIIHVTF